MPKKALEASLTADLESGEDDEALQDNFSDEDDDGLTGGFGFGGAGMDNSVPRRVVRQESFNDGAPQTKRPRVNLTSFATKAQEQSLSHSAIPGTGIDLTNQQAGFQRLVEAIADPDKVNRNIKLSASQMAIYNTITKGKCANGAVAQSAQLFAESFQSLDLGFVWYPFLCVGLLTFDFQRTVSITMFQYEEWFTVAKRTNTVDMSDFGRKAKTVTAPVLKSVAQLVGCIGQLLRVCQLVYVQPLVDAVDHLRTFVMTQECMELDMGPDPVPALVIWVNNRLAAIRQAFAMDSPFRLRLVVASMDTSGTEYRRVLQECESKKWRAFQASVTSGKRGDYTKGDAAHNPKKDKGKSHRRGDDKLSTEERAKSKELFDICFKGMPKDGTKNVCFNNLTAAGCKVKACKLSHTLVAKASIPSAVATALSSLYGALREDLP